MVGPDLLQALSFTWMNCRVSQWVGAGLGSDMPRPPHTSECLNLLRDMRAPRDSHLGAGLQSDSGIGFYYYGAKGGGGEEGRREGGEGGPA